MTKNYWAGGMVVSLIFTGGVAIYLYDAIKAKATVEVPLEKVSISVPKQTEKVKPTPALSPTLEKGKETKKKIQEKKEAPSTLEKTKKTTGLEKEPATTPVADTTTRNILFTYYNSHATEVHMIGDFTNWFREPFEKKDSKTWVKSQALSPGTYEYQYVVEGRKIRDPNNKMVSKKGKSVITIKPRNLE